MKTKSKRESIVQHSVLQTYRLVMPLAVGCLIVAGCGPKTTKVKTIKVNLKCANSSIEHLSPNVFMVPVDHGESGQKEPVSFEALLTRLADDRESLTLARKLYWNVPLELAVVSTAKEWKDVPKEKEKRCYSGPSFVYLRVQATTAMGESTGSPLAGMWNILRLSVQESENAESSTDKDRPIADDDEALLLLCNDYLLRHGVGWIVVNGPENDTAKSIKRELDDANAAHAKQIESYLRKYAMPTPSPTPSPK